MKNSVLFFLLVTFIIISFTFYSCVGINKQKSEKVFFVNTGEEAVAINLSLSYIMWVSGSCGDAKGALPVHKEDLLYITLSEKEEIPLLLQYDEKDGTDLSFSYDTEKDHDYFYTMNDSIVQLNLSTIPEIYQLLEKATINELKNIRTLYFYGDIDSFPAGLLEKIAKENNHPGIYIENPKQLMKVLQVFQPDWILIENWDSFNGNKDMENELYALLKKQKNLKTLFFIPNGEKPDADYTFLSSLPALKNVMISSSVFNQLISPTLPDNLKYLEKLLIFNTSSKEEHDISFVKEFINIKKISFIGMKISGTVEDLYSLSGLTALSFTGTELKNLHDSKEMPSVKWFSFPINTDQMGFESFVKKNPQLEYCEIIGCKSITDFSPLESLKKLKGLIIIDKEIIDYSQLYNIADLEFLILPEAFFEEENKAEREELKNKLPDSRIVCGEPFCLGSGWIVMFPLIIFLCLVFIICIKKFRVHTNKRM